jgi:hypothetical protein
MTVSELVETTLHAEVAFPETAIGGASRHGSQQKGVDLNHLLDSATGNVGTHGGTRIDRHNDAAVELESERGGALGELDLLAIILVSRSRTEVGFDIVSGLNE